MAGARNAADARGRRIRKLALIPGTGASGDKILSRRGNKFPPGAPPVI